MVRVQPIAAVSDWLLTVAEVLPLPHRAARPYTLGEAVAEFGAYAQATAATRWNTISSKKYRDSMLTEIEAQSSNLGKALRVSTDPLLKNLRNARSRDEALSASTRFCEAWHSASSITQAFQDLCDSARIPTMTSRRLRKLAVIIASQIGQSAHGSFSRLDQAAGALIDIEEDLRREATTLITGAVTEARRYDMARDILVTARVGRITVWTAYSRAIVWRMREEIGPITFLDAAWALPSVFDNGPIDFPELAELQEISEAEPWLKKLHVESLKPENRLAIVRVDLGDQEIAGAADEALRRVDAVLSVAVEAGGVSWQNIGTTITRIDGKASTASYGSSPGSRPGIEDQYGMRATAEILENLADQLRDAFAKKPMPEHLVEALAALREARMTDHRDVRFYDARPVTPRIATALEDHALELIASTLNVRSETLANTLQVREAQMRSNAQMSTQLFAPFKDAWARDYLEEREKLKRSILVYQGKQPRLSIEKTIASSDEILGLPMTALQRADFEDAIDICTNPKRELELLKEMDQETGLLRARLRRVRNAINHGLPLAATTLNSIRDYANETSSAALNIALTWFKNDEQGAALLQREDDTWSDRIDRVTKGLSWIDVNAQRSDSDIEAD